MKKILCLVLIVFLVYLIYYFNHSDKINYLAIGDSLSVGIDANGNTDYGYSTYLANYLRDKDLLKSYNNDFSASNSRVSDLIDSLKLNQTIIKDNKNLSLKKCLRESNLITLSIGMTDILTKITLSTTSVETMSNKEISNIVDETITELDTLFQELRKYAKDEIIFIGYYNCFKKENLVVKRLYSYLITKTKELAKKYDINYLDTYNIFQKNKSYLSNPTSIYPSTIAYEAIATEIIENYLPKS